MKKFLTVSILIILFVFSGSLTATKINPQPEYFEISPSVTMAKHTYGSNITCIAVKNGLYFVDCGLNTTLLQNFRKDMEKKYQKKTLGLIMSHVHIDHFFGMGAMKDVDIMAAENSKEGWKYFNGVDYKNPRRIAGLTAVFPKFKESQPVSELVMPKTWLKEETLIGEGEDRLIFTTTGGHSFDSSSIYFPKEGVLIAGDLVQNNQVPYFGDRTNSMKNWIKTFKRWETMPIKKICPGHGKPADLKLVKTMRIYFEKIVAVIKKLKGQKVPLEKIINHQDLPKGYWDKNLPLPPWFKLCITSVYKEVK